MSIQGDAEFTAFLKKYIVGRTFGIGSVSTIKYCKSVVDVYNPFQYEVALKTTDRKKLPVNYPIHIEANILKAISHVNIVGIFDSCLTQNKLYLSLEYVPGRNLNYFIENCFKFEKDDIAKIMCDLSSALSHLHNHRMVHRDINPRNLILIMDNCCKVQTLKVVDFGTASCLDSRGPHPPWYGSTIRFCAPELRFSQYYGCEVDVFSAGVVLCYLIFGLDLVDFDFCLYELDFGCSCYSNIPAWFNDSTTLKGLIRGMLDKNGFTRLKAADVYHHIWVRAFSSHLPLELADL